MEISYNQNIILEEMTKYILIGSIWIFGMFMIKLYAPADTENVTSVSVSLKFSTALPGTDS